MNDMELDALYATVKPEDLPPLPPITDEEAAEMADASDDGYDPEDAFPDDDGMTDAEADADALRGAGMGTDEDYGGDVSFWDEGLIGGDSDLGGEY